MNKELTEKEYQLKRNFRPKNLFIKNATKNVRRPAYDVGEHLPKIEGQEIEIVRISLATTTGDVISIRASYFDETYIIKIVDEYESVFHQFLEEYQKIPTQGELIDIIIWFNDENTDNGMLFNILSDSDLNTLEEIKQFIQIDSTLYPDLNNMFIYLWKLKKISNVE